MEKNIGNIDRVIRFIVGILLFYLVFKLNEKFLIVILSALGAISVLESFTGYCGLYKLLKINTGGK